MDSKLTEQEKEFLKKVALLNYDTYHDNEIMKRFFKLVLKIVNDNDKIKKS